ncbi:MAG: phosphate ABC transporter permease PstA [Phycisphaeraceae bacterium]|nr:phosphate ABC transporter permease PstA [Phycisphaeraceae bacterium]
MSVQPQGQPAGTPSDAHARAMELRRSSASVNSMLAQGRPMLWVTGGALSVCIVMILGLLGLVLYQGASTFWPRAVTRVQLHDGRVFMGEVTRDGWYTPRQDEIDAFGDAGREAIAQSFEDHDGRAYRRLFRTANFDVSGSHFTWVSDYQVAEEDRPEWAILFERQSWGRFFGTPVAFILDGEQAATDPTEIWSLFRQNHPEVRARFAERVNIEKRQIGRINRAQERERLRLRDVEIRSGRDSAQYRERLERLQRIEADATERFGVYRQRINALNAENNRYALLMRTADGQEVTLRLSEIVRAFTPNRLSFADKVGVYLSRWREFLLDDPREANSEGGVWPAIFGTVTMTIIMSVAVVPFGVLAALYLREYAKGGVVVSAVRIAVNNLAGVPSIVFGVFGLGFFCYLMGGTIDQIFFQSKLPSPTFGTGGILWASLTLALLTLPVVIVATEEALAAVPSSMRDGSYACGASKWQTIKRIVLPRAMPGIMTGTILAMARGAGEVAPLMLVGAVKLAPELPIDSEFPFIHPERSFMHLGFHIFDLGFQSQNSEAAKPMVFTTTLLLIFLIATLNLTAIALRGRLRRKFKSAAF